jgi:methyl-accepting chemotaxis protein
MWTFGKRIAAGFALSFVLLLLVGGVAYRSINALTQTSHGVAHSHTVLDHVAGLLSLLKDAETGQRGFVITGDDAFLEPYEKAIGSIASMDKDLRDLTADNPAQQRRLDELEPVIATRLDELRRSIEVRRTAGFEPAQKIVAASDGRRAMDGVRRVLAGMEREERNLLQQRADEVDTGSAVTKSTMAFGTLLCLLLLTGAALFIVRALTRQIGLAIQHVQSSSGELQAAANLQVSGSREQATAMSEITTTISELLATSRQIAESAQRVARISTETVSAARTGDEIVVRTQELLATIKRQVDLIVAHMIELGKKSQQIGGVLEIINELAEQTNILAINATIEAAGAGEAGKRFAVVADEIRKLADRVGGSTKDIRALVEEVRAAVNTTVMATEGGSKAADAGARQFSEVTTSFRQIAGMVTNTTEAAKEIELSTKQQSSAVEQVKLAAATISKATNETETSASQTLQTSFQLASLSQDLMRLIRPQPRA